MITRREAIAAAAVALLVSGCRKSKDSPVAPMPTEFVQLDPPQPPAPKPTPKPVTNGGAGGPSDTVFPFQGNGWTFDPHWFTGINDQVMELQHGKAGTKFWVSSSWWTVPAVRDKFLAFFDIFETVPNLKGEKTWLDVTQFGGYKNWDVVFAPRVQLFPAGNGIWASGSTSLIAPQMILAWPPNVGGFEAQKEWFSGLAAHEIAHALGWGDIHNGHPENCATCQAGNL